jgi:dTDP-4-amino-4,6-dideoxygalactose transaminase
MPERRIGVGHVSTTIRAREYIGAVLDSEWYSPGKWCARLEREWAALHERKHAVFVNSGTSALHVALAALKERYGWQTGYRVLVPALTFVATVNVVIANRLKPVFVDVDPYYGIDLSAPPPPDTVAVIPVHVNGQQCDMEHVRAFADLYDLAVVEDSCECVAARRTGRMRWGEISCYSTYSCHHVSTGVGGLACTDEADLAVLLRSFANHGRDGIYFDPSAPTEELVARRFRFERQGFSYRASEFEAAIGCAQLPDLDTGLRRRRDIADFFAETLSDTPLVLPRARPGGDWWPMFYPVLTPLRNKMEAFLEENGVETRRFLPLTDQPVYRNLVDEDEFPFAKRVNAEGLYWGCHPGMSDTDLSRVDALVHDFFRRRT